MAKQDDRDDQVNKARAVALRLLARREHSRLELSLKLRQRRIDEGIIAQVLDDYEQEGWLDDRRFADVYARQRIDQGYGPLRILGELQQRGVHQPPDCLEDMADSDWCDRAIRLRERRFGLADLRDAWDEKARQARFLSRRGFTSAQIERALEVSAPPEDL